MQISCKVTQIKGASPRETPPWGRRRELCRKWKRKIRMADSIPIQGSRLFFTVCLSRKPFLKEQGKLSISKSPRVCQEICVKKREEVCSRRGSFRVSLEQALECAYKCHHPSPADYGQAPSSGSDDRPTSFPAPSRVGREVSGASLHWERRLCG